MNQLQPPQPPPQAAPAGAQQMLAPQSVPAHLMGLMATNPALVAAAASGVFPPAAMLSNPGAFLAIPEAFAANGGQAGHHQQQQQQAGVVHQVSAPGGMVLPRLAVAGMGNFGVDAAPAGMATMAQQQSAHQQAQELLQQQQQAQIVPLLGGDPMNADTDDNRSRRTDLSPEDRAKQNRDRNREHARSTRLRKKAYVQKLKELVEGLHAERTEEVRQRRVAIQHLAEMQNVRRGVVRTFLRFHSGCETDARKWETILEDDFWLKQPVTPYRSFRRTEIEQDCRLSRGVQGMIADAASVSVMVEGVGSRSTRWMQIKREEFLFLEESKRGPSRMPRSITRQDSRSQAGISSLSSSGSSNAGSASDGKNVSSSSSSSESRRKQLTPGSKDFHDYHAQPLPDPKMASDSASNAGSTSPSEESPEESNGSTNGDGGKRVCTDSSSGDDSAAAIAGARAMKRRKTDGGNDAADAERPSNLPPNIAKTGGITANVLGVGTVNARLNTAPAVPLPPFTGLGKRAAMPASAAGSSQAGAVSNGSIVRSGVDNPLSPSGSSLGRAAMVAADTETSSSNSTPLPQIRACYHMNEDDMILMEDVLMCPFVFRSQDAVVCGALAECVMPGMFRAHFSARNKLLSVEMVYDAMGFMQQLERASGSERTAQIIPGSLEMALSPSSTEARVITLAEPPFLIVNVNEVWTRLTKYTQMEVEGRELLALLEGEKTLPDADARPGKPHLKFEDVAKGLCATTTNVHYNKDGREFVDYVCSYPLTNANDEITHLLHTSKELPALPNSIPDQ